MPGAATIERIAITRAVSRALQDCELSHLTRRPIDLALARRQHAGYAEALRGAGCRVVELPEQPDRPDSVFVEDTAVVLDEVAVATRPGAASRRGEVDSVATALAARRTVARIAAPATLDGGDVLRLGRALYVGASARSNDEGRAQLAAIVAPYGYRVEAAPIHGCLHLKSAVTAVADDRLLVNPAWVDAGRFPGWRVIEIDPAEPYAANALWVGDRVLHPAACLRTAARMRGAGINVVSVDVSEVQKAEGGVTCCSVILRA